MQRRSPAKPGKRHGGASSRGFALPKLDARPDTVDFRDRMYTPSLVEVPVERPLGAYLKLKVPILNQGKEGSCTGFGLATVANYLLRTRAVRPDLEPVSPRMLYDLARRYDEWPGADYAGSSARGAMKGWHKHGVCSEKLWPYDPENPRGLLTAKRAEDAAVRPLGAYFRVSHKDLVGLHAAIAEVGILYATAVVHGGWSRVDSRTGDIPLEDKALGGHAFAIVGYDRRGLWIQNSWGRAWGKAGLARISYDDWLKNGTDVWVARLGAPVELARGASSAISRSAAAGGRETYSQAELRPHIVRTGNDGRLSPGGAFGTTRDSVREIFEVDFPRITRSWSQKRLLLYAHGGLVSEVDAVQRLAEYLPSLLESEVYPLSFVWRSDYWTTMTNMLEDAFRRRRSEGVIDAIKDFMLDRLDDALEPLARVLTGKASWDEMKENAEGATLDAEGGARIVAEHIGKLMEADPSVELHVLGHSAGSIFHAPLVQLLTSDGSVSWGDGQTLDGLGLDIQTLTLWAPACTMALFRQAYLPAIQSGKVKQFALYTLTDAAEQSDHCARIYNKSLLYLVSNAFEEYPRIPLVRPAGVPLLGMEVGIRSKEPREGEPELDSLFQDGRHEWILAPNGEPKGSLRASTASHHGDFDDDTPTVLSTLRRITGTREGPQPSGMAFHSSASKLREQRGSLQRAR